MSETGFQTAFGQWILRRGGEERNHSLRAWSSADLYLLNRLAEDYEVEEGSSVLVLNDAFGALTLPLSQKYRVYSWNDSFCAEKQIKANMKENGLDEKSVFFLTPGDPLPEEPALAVLKNPKSLNFLEYILQLLSSQLRPGTKVLAGDMARNIHSSTVSLFETYLPGARTSLAWKKARLAEGLTSGPVKGGTSYPVEYKPESLSSVLVNYPNLFAFGRLDPGSAFMLDHMPEPSSVPERVVDVACGDGVLALKAAELWSEASFLCADESRLAVRSVRESFERNNFAGRAEFLVTDILEGVENNMADLVLCNPPFHDNHSLSTSTAIRMFHQSHNILKKGGELFVIANRHLGYENQLRNIFDIVQIKKSNKKFSIIRAVK